MRNIVFTIALFMLPTVAAGNEALQFKDGKYVLGAYDYHCTGSDGTRYEMGEVVCLINNSCSEAWLAKCDMSLNNPMWRKVQDGCPAATLLQRFQNLQPGLYSVPVDAAVAISKS